MPGHRRNRSLHTEMTTAATKSYALGCTQAKSVKKHLNKLKTTTSARFSDHRKIVGDMSAALSNAITVHRDTTIAINEETESCISVYKTCALPNVKILKTHLTPLLPR